MTKATLLYDADCGFCRWAIDKILRWDRRGNLRAITIQSAEGSAMLPDLSPERRLESWHLVDAAGAHHAAGDVAVPLARLLPFGAPIALLGRAMPRLTNRFYFWVARNRDKLGARLGTQACSVDPSARKRA